MCEREKTHTEIRTYKAKSGTNWINLQRRHCKMPSSQTNKQCAAIEENEKTRRRKNKNLRTIHHDNKNLFKTISFCIYFIGNFYFFFAPVPNVCEYEYSFEKRNVSKKLLLMSSVGWVLILSNWLCWKKWRNLKMNEWMNNRN